MTESEFDELAAKVLSDEASPEDAASLESALALNAQWRQRLDELREAKFLIVELGWMQKALDVPIEPIPDDRLQQLRNTVRQHFPPKRGPERSTFLSRLWLFLGMEDGKVPSLRMAGAAFAAVLVVCVFTFILSTRHPREDQLAMPATRFLALYAQPTARRSGEAISLYTPSASTRSLHPWIIWKTDPGKTYDLVITDELNPQAEGLRLAGAMSPVDFSTVTAWKGKALKPGTLYRLKLSEPGTPLSESTSTFRTSDNASDLPRLMNPSEKLERARQLLTSEAVSAGDVLAELLTLPPASANSELALRLKIIAFSRLGLREEYDAAAGKLKKLTGVQ